MTELLQSIHDKLRELSSKGEIEITITTSELGMYEFWNYLKSLGFSEEKSLTEHDFRLTINHDKKYDTRS